MLPNDPKKLHEYLNKYVNIKLKKPHKNDQLFGWIYTIDPVSLSVVLVNFVDTDKAKEVVVVMSDEIDDLKVIGSNSTQGSEIIDNNHFNLVKTKLDNLFASEEQLITSDRSENESKLTEISTTSQLELNSRRDKLFEWIKKNHIPVKLDMDVINILDTVLIRPPYTVNSCDSTNEIILDKVRKLVTNLP